MRATHFLFFLFLGFLLAFATKSHAAVIFSTCPVAVTQTDGSVEKPVPAPEDAGKPTVETVDRFRPEQFRSVLRRYSQDLPKAINFIVWLLDHNPEATMGEGDAVMEANGLFLEDLEFVNALAAEKKVCHDSRKRATQALAIFPFALKVPGENGASAFRVRYKVCEYYVDNKRQLPIENACMVLGRETGYSFEELEKRMGQLNLHIQNSRSVVEGATLVVGLLAAVPMYKSARYLRAGAMTTIGATALPIGAAYLATEMKWTDEVIRNVIDFKEAGEVAITGDLTTSVGVNMPMHEFIPYFQRYLESMDN